ncbi:MAG: hypothetical protein WCK86_22845, partial [Planctomycetia bacterium]
PLPEPFRHLTCPRKGTSLELDCLNELESVAEIPPTSGARNQNEIYEATGSRRKVVEKLLESPAW